MSERWGTHEFAWTKPNIILAHTDGSLPGNRCLSNLRGPGSFSLFTRRRRGYQVQIALFNYWWGMDQGLRGQSACLYLLADLRRFGPWLTSEFHRQVASTRSSLFARIFLSHKLAKFNLIFFSFLHGKIRQFSTFLKRSIEAFLSDIRWRGRKISFYRSLWVGNNDWNCYCIENGLSWFKII